MPKLLLLIVPLLCGGFTQPDTTCKEIAPAVAAAPTLPVVWSTPFWTWDPTLENPVWEVRQYGATYYPWELPPGGIWGATIRVERIANSAYFNFAENGYWVTKTDPYQ